MSAEEHVEGEVLLLDAGAGACLILVWELRAGDLTRAVNEPSRNFTVLLAESAYFSDSWL